MGFSLVTDEKQAAGNWERMRGRALCQCCGTEHVQEQPCSWGVVCKCGVRVQFKYPEIEKAAS